MTQAHDAVGSYVVDALDPAERAEFETHLAGCESCQLEVAELTEVVAELASLTADLAPPELRTSLLAAIEHAPQPANDGAVPRYVHGRLTAHATPTSRTSVMAGIDQPHPLATHEVAPLEEHPSVVPDWSWSVPIDDLTHQLAARRNRRVRRILSAVVAAVVVVALALGGAVYVLTQRNQAQVAASRLDTELLTAPDAKIYTSTVNGTTVRYVVSKQRDQALFLGSNLAAPGPNFTYQLWTLKGKAATPAGLVPMGGTVRQLFTVPVGDADSLAVTREPAPSGSSAPTSTPLFTVTI